MASFQHRLFFVCFLFFFLALSTADPIGEYCNNNEILSSNQSSQVDQLLSALVVKAPVDGFAVDSYRGIYGLAQCRGDVDVKNCTACITDAAEQIRQICPNQADARIWYDYCFLRYSTEDFIGKLDTGYGIFYYNVNNVTALGDEFDEEVRALIERLRAEALGPGRLKLGKGETRFSPFATIYGFVQCTRDLSTQLCNQCLATAIAKYPTFCQYKVGCQVNYSSCRLRYETYPFFFPLDSSRRVAATASVKAVVYP